MSKINVVSPLFSILAHTINMEKICEIAGRTCTNTINRITEDSNEVFLERIIKNGHESVLEHANITVQLTLDRAGMMELTRHRIASFSVESSRYVNYKKALPVIKPIELLGNNIGEFAWIKGLESIHDSYISMLNNGVSIDTARTILPLCLATDLVITANVREWRHIFDLRCDKRAYSVLRNLMDRIRSEFQDRWPILFRSK